MSGSLRCNHLRWASVFHADCNILVIGDGDLSYALSLARSLFQTNDFVHNGSLIATTFDPIDTLHKKYSNVDDILKELNEFEHVETYHDIDGTNIRTSLDNAGWNNNNIDKPFERIIWNFPHAGGKNFILKNRKLMLDFFHSADELLTLDKDSGIFVTLACAQGGTDFEINHVPDDIQKGTKKPFKREYSDHWRIVEQGGSAGLYLRDIMFFNPPESYRPRGYRDVLQSAHKGFRTNYSVTHCFSKYIELSKSDASSRFDSLFKSVYEQFKNNFEDFKCDTSISFHLKEEYSLPNLPYELPFTIPYLEHIMEIIFPKSLDILEIKNMIRKSILSFVKEDDNLENWKELSSMNSLILSYYTNSKYYKNDKLIDYKIGEFIEDNDNIIWKCSLEHIILCSLKSDEIRWFGSRNIKAIESLEDQIHQSLFHDSIDFCFKEPVLFSPLLSYDVSFWLPENQTQLNTNELGKSILSWDNSSLVCGVKLVDRYEMNPSKISECYRISYQQLDGALHSEQAKDIHSKFSEHLGKTLNLKLRS